MSDDDGPAGDGWLRAADGTAYPPGPWFLGADLLVSVLRVPEERLAGLAHALPDGCEAVPVGGALLVGLAVARYAPGGVLAYDELLVAALTTDGRGPRVTIPQIWVTSTASRAGGRDLWGIPKDLAVVRRSEQPLGSGTTARRAGAPSRDAPRTRIRTDVRAADGRPIARLTARVGPRLSPVPVVLPLPTAQRRPDGTGVVAHNTVTGTPRRLAVRWDLPEGGPLAHLRGLRPVASVAVTDATVVFGRRVHAV
ncbi:acetoacetate decarboxylase family protein [Cellulomonas fimi]|uniref:Acetoacetate decarboxylase n=1 Tax=Cellulomonas fimi (strain ATCC 484 / DSM 20113 / JCM 1341 / CCUG 24087 / LMG 16345 / NBRC 15513 / NCIMB 8980 / NCTC 7547 / NRS-133) TaxID=590998 RepID=F4H2Z1_CELFA|nr:acetoacetate decarboxylase family protein [Cellulomonas fimi]AEE47609.1 hypothetical protein Celf_3498 [Cellulomonas fimi ATCC 484]VEH36636.1 Acetoacetate decarboxylase (ADC) [Cellulomonas fimi]